MEVAASCSIVAMADTMGDTMDRIMPHYLPHLTRSNLGSEPHYERSLAKARIKDFKYRENDLFSFDY